MGLSLAWYLIQVMGMPDYIGAAGAIVGVTISEMAALIYMAVNFVRSRRLEPPAPRDRTDSALSILKTCLALAIPITLTSSSTSIITAVDNSLVLGRLQHAGLMLTEDAARELMGNYTGVPDRLSDSRRPDGGHHRLGDPRRHHLLYPAEPGRRG